MQRTPAWKLFSLLSILAGCAPAHPPSEASYFHRSSTSLQLTENTSWNDQWWLAKTSRALRGGNSLSKKEDAAALLAQGKEKVVDQFLKDPRFADTILDFSMMVLGYRQDLIKYGDGQYNYLAFQHPQAIRASKEVASDGDFFRLFDLNQNLYMPQLASPPRYLYPEDSALSDSALRLKIFNKMQMGMDDLIALSTQLSAKQPTSNPEVCKKYKEYTDTYLNKDALGIALSVSFNQMYRAEYYGTVNSYCYSAMQKPFDFVSEFTKIKTKNALLFSLLVPFEKENYKPTSVSAIQSLDLSGVLPTYRNTQFSPLLAANSLPNSSTNYDRKRGAYILKRFLCDDLTPINVENPSTHAGDAHGTNPSCFACHYKLDPIAGFFRNYGAGFMDFTGANNIRFDDNASMKLVDYVKAWAPGPNTDHPLNVGYIRSTQDLSKNFYGSSLDDLFTFLKTAPEARRCIVRRAYEYLVSPDQTIDGDYLNYLTDAFNEDTLTVGSSRGLKNVFKNIVLGKAFGTQNADHDTCYDRKPGYFSDGTEAPCKVSSILAQNCVKCHASTDDSGNLDLSHWQKLPDGSYGFPHLDGNGDLMPAAKTFQMMIDRISSTDSEARMPYRSDMPSQDRQQLFNWLNQAIGPGVAK